MQAGMLMLEQYVETEVEVIAPAFLHFPQLTLQDERVFFQEEGIYKTVAQKIPRK